MDPVVASDKLKRTEVWPEVDESVHWIVAFAVYGGHGTTASSTIVTRLSPGNGSAGTPMPQKRRNISSLAPPSCTWKMVRKHPVGVWERFRPADADETRSG